MKTIPVINIRLFNRMISVAALLALSASCATAQAARDPLPSWNDGPAKQAIVDFVATAPPPKARPKFVPPPERIATFDNDGTLWCEQPMYFQLLFALDRVKALAPQHPEWKDEGALCLAAQGRCEERRSRAASRPCSKSSWPPTRA